MAKPPPQTEPDPDQEWRHDDVPDGGLEERPPPRPPSTLEGLIAAVHRLCTVIERRDDVLIEAAHLVKEGGQVLCDYLADLKSSPPEPQPAPAQSGGEIAARAAAGVGVVPKPTPNDPQRSPDLPKGRGMLKEEVEKIAKFSAFPMPDDKFHQQMLHEDAGNWKKKQYQSATWAQVLVHDPQYLWWVIHMEVERMTDQMLLARGYGEHNLPDRKNDPHQHWKQARDHAFNWTTWSSKYADTSNKALWVATHGPRILGVEL